MRLLKKARLTGNDFRALNVWLRVYVHRKPSLASHHDYVAGKLSQGNNSSIYKTGKRDQEF